MGCVYSGKLSEMLTTEKYPITSLAEIMNRTQKIILSKRYGANLRFSVN